MLIQVLGIENSGKTLEILNFYGRKVMEPMEIWVPKSWIKLDYEQEPWIWEQGFLKNLKALAEKRKKFLKKIFKKNFQKKFSQKNFLKINF